MRRTHAFFLVLLLSFETYSWGHLNVSNFTQNVVKLLTIPNREDLIGNTHNIKGYKIDEGMQDASFALNDLNFLVIKEDEDTSRLPLVILEASMEENYQQSWKDLKFFTKDQDGEWVFVPLRIKNKKSLDLKKFDSLTYNPLRIKSKFEDLYSLNTSMDTDVNISFKENEEGKVIGFVSVDYHNGPLDQAKDALGTLIYGLTSGVR